MNLMSRLIVGSIDNINQRLLCTAFRSSHSIMSANSLVVAQKGGEIVRALLLGTNR